MKTIKSKVALYLHNKSVALLILFTRYIITMMTGNPHFVTPDPALADVSTAADEVEQAEEFKKTLGIVNRNMKLAILLNLLTRLGGYVNQIADGDGSIIESAGMSVRKVPQPKELPDAVKGIKVRDGADVGEAVVSHGGASGVGNEYFYEYSTDPNLAPNTWHYIKPTGRHKLLITGLSSGQRTAFRVRAFNTAGFGPYSSVVFRVIQ